jgi:hypothetical protein
MLKFQHTVRPRRMGGVGHFFRLRPALGLALGVVCAAAALPGSAIAQDIGLRRGEASLNAGQFTDAARQLSATVNDKDATINQVAKALYLRGIAYRRAGYPGQAAADLGAALWLGLPSSDKPRAYVNKGLAFQAAGMQSQGASAMAQARRYSSASTVQKLTAQDGGVGPVASGGIASYIPSASGVWNKVVPSLGGPKKTAGSGGAAAPTSNTSMWDKIVPSFGAQKTAMAPEGATAAGAQSASAGSSAAAPQAAPTSGWDASVSEGSGGNAVSRWWGSVAGGGASTAAQTTPAATTQSAPVANTTTGTRTAAAAPTAGSTSGSGGAGIGGWFSRQTAALTGAGAGSSSRTGSGFTVQLANSSSRSEAEALWSKAKRSNSSLASTPSRVETVNMGSLGTFYTVKIGPFASQSEGSKACNSIKRGGTDCTVVAPGG